MTQQNKKIKGYGLLTLPKDDRDFMFGSVFKLPKIEELPDNYSVPGKKFIKDQNGTDMCTAYAVTAVSEDQEEVELSPFYTFAKIKQVMGGDTSEWGADLRSACKAAKNYGFEEVKEILPIPTMIDRDIIVAKDWSSVDKNNSAKKHAKGSYLSVNGPYDTFDNMRATMWKLRNENRSIFTGINWRPSWDNSSIVRDFDENERGYGHAIKIFGWVKFDDGFFLEAQLSNGTTIGNGGIFYLSRKVINSESGDYGAFTFSDMPKEDIEYKLGRIGFLNYWFKFLFS